MTKEENKNEIVFKDGSKHILDDAGRNGILVFRDAISEAPFDDKSDYSGDYSKSTVKALIEKWWEDNASNELKAKYDVALLSAEEVFSQEELDAYYDGSGKKAPKSIQLPLFANDWRNKCKNLFGKKYGTWWWLRTQSPWYCYGAATWVPQGRWTSTTLTVASRSFRLATRKTLLFSMPRARLAPKAMNRKPQRSTSAKLSIVSKRVRRSPA